MQKSDELPSLSKAPSYLIRRYKLRFSIHTIIIGNQMSKLLSHLIIRLQILKSFLHLIILIQINKEYPYLIINQILNLHHHFILIIIRKLLVYLTIFNQMPHHFIIFNRVTATTQLLLIQLTLPSSPALLATTIVNAVSSTGVITPLRVLIDQDSQIT